MADSSKYAELLANWDVNAYQDRADFLVWLYEYYKCTDGLYTGLYQRFIDDLANGLLHDLYYNYPHLFEVLKDRLSWA